MEKSNIIISQELRICLLGLLWSFLWLYVLYYHLGVHTSLLSVNHHIITSKTAISLQTENPKHDNDPCVGRYIYVHDLPSRFNQDYINECGSINKFFDMCKLIKNNGFGPAMNNTELGVLSDDGWYETDHFTLDFIFHNRMKQYECLTNDSSKAAAIFVPFYAGFDASKYLWGYNISVRDAASLDLVDWLQKRDEWKIMNGQDHFLVGGRPCWDYRRASDKVTDWGNKLLMLPASRNMTMLTIESSITNSNDFAIPYPTNFHPSKDSEIFNWQYRVMQIERKWLFCFAGAPRPNDHSSIRSLLIDQCKNSSVGKHLECGVGETKCRSPSSIMNMFKRSVFCLQPRGDSATRRSAFDSILAGCIPVFFHQDSFYTQYTWHVAINHIKYSVFISEDDIRKNLSIEEHLSRIDPTKIKMMRKEVINLIPRVLYARSKLDTLKDAFDVSVEAIINKVTQLRRSMLYEGGNDKFIEELG